MLGPRNDGPHLNMHQLDVRVINSANSRVDRHFHWVNSKCNSRSLPGLDPGTAFVG